MSQQGILEEDLPILKQGFKLDTVTGF